MMLVDDSSKIHVLPSEVIGRIAAGEVVERPAAVVKELIENSLDAGSTTIAVEIQDGGLELIRVTDNGEGMSRQDALLAFERHATSKLRSDADLDTVRTLGFRGEALPSIAAVSRVKISTAASGQPIGTRISIAGGRVETVETVLDELEATRRALDLGQDGDVIVVCVDHANDVWKELQRRQHGGASGAMAAVTSLGPNDGGIEVDA